MESVTETQLPGPREASGGGGGGARHRPTRVKEIFQMTFLTFTRFVEIHAWDRKVQAATALTGTGLHTHSWNL